MHRSGTSMLAHLLYECGLNLGAPDELIPGTEHNPDGHWEHASFVRLNEELLNRHGGAWDQPPELAPDWQHDDSGRAIHSAAEELIRRFAAGRSWGWKDPRNCLTLPFWYELLPDLRVIACVRNPLDVASSLHKRGMSSYGFGLTLWQTYNERLVCAVPRDRRIVVHYNKLLADFRSELRRILAYVELPASDDQLRSAGEAVKANLRHHSFSIDDLVAANVAPAIIDLYERLSEESGWSESAEIKLSRRALQGLACPSDG